MFVLDAYEGHLLLEVRAMNCAMNTDLVIPGRMISQHVLMNKPFKGHFKQFYYEWLLVGDYVLTPREQ
jgi:hypothetical protein